MVSLARSGRRERKEPRLPTPRAKSTAAKNADSNKALVLYAQLIERLAEGLDMPRYIEAVRLVSKLLILVAGSSYKRGIKAAKKT
jgi:hypothetical protein